MKASGAIRVDLFRSRWLVAVLAGAHVATLVPLVWAGLPIWATAPLALAVLAHGVWTIRRFALLHSARSVIAVTLHPDGDCALTLRNGADLTGRVDPATVVLGTVVILAVRRGSVRPGARALIAQDMVSDEDFRRLRVGLKWGAVQEVGASHA